ncbi:uncharacterized protein LOC122990812 [Thunnus albacares]|uniref:uncharacterized protein LOC122990812 n=1 Tax=Thunnus albacares TaxID=8236 RepID=UPI001CF6DF57|nr:uncharacterized protein LOC122990812 [Thunnus albacares]
MVMRGISLYILLGHLFIAHLPVQCLECDTGEALADCPPCKDNDCDIPPKCKKVSIKSPKSSVDEGETVTLICVHNFTDLNLTFEWLKDGKLMKDQKESNLTLKEVLTSDEGCYICRVNSTHGSYESLPHSVTVNNGSVVILVVCGVSALVLVLIMGMAMKLKMKRDNIKHKERRNRRVQAGQSGGPSPITPRES